MINKINEIKKNIEAATASTAEAVEQLRIKYLSKKGEVAALMADFRNVPAEQKREMGQKLNELKTLVTDKINALKEGLAGSADNEAASIDLTRTATPFPVGSRHPLSIVKNDIIDIFAGMGFTIAEGPEIEDDWHVFSSLNFPKDHPAR
ncbi:MAG: phenylalanine--tRNA ligase subunit alpha, partial [Muribaculaceae bacterium]|nr:phenylalanine--tRNA ligase subunit alpha [Muribaculaceae bacterium]